ncbi:MAG TPA: BlaI/MecI/CopY family transcriptional regulator [Streptosporangiaceae bacterium]
MARFGDLEAAIMDVMWEADSPLRVREVAGELNQTRPLAFNTVQTVMENLFRQGWLNRQKDGRAYRYVTVRSREDYVAGLLGEALAVARDPAATLVRLVEDLEPDEIARLRVALDAAAERESPR